MITVRVGNLLDSKAQTLVNTVNTVGIMGKGIALEFKRRFPGMYQDYAARCVRHEVKLGRPYPFYLPDHRIILNFPTKEHWRSVSRLDAVVEGLKELQAHHREWGIKSIAVPPLGCGNGQLEWRVVGPTLYRYLSQLDIPVELFAPHGTPASELQLSFFEPDHHASPYALEEKIPAGWVAIVDALARVTGQRFHWPVGRVRYQKLAYFLGAVGVPTGIEHERGSYGPYAPAMKPITAKLLNNGLVVERRVGRMFTLSPGPTYEDAKLAYAAQLGKWDELIDRVADLFARLQTDQTEVAATVHLAAVELTAKLGRKPSEVEVHDEVMKWKARRRPPIESPVVAATIRNLGLLRWIDVEPSPDLGDEDELLIGVGSAGP